MICLILCEKDRFSTLDVHASSLALATRRAPISGDEFRADRDALAGILGPGVAADLLRSGRAIRVLSPDGRAWEIKLYPDVPSSG